MDATRAPLAAEPAAPPVSWTHRFEAWGAAASIAILRCLPPGRRVLRFGGHIGNWEIAGLAAAQYGLDIAQIYRAPNNPLIDRIVARLRGGGSELIPKGTIASRRAVAALRRGGHVSLLAD